MLYMFSIIGEYSLSIVKSKTSPNEGPTMALTYGTSSFISGHIEGYGSCVVFEGDVKLKIQTTEPLNVVLYPDPETGLNRRSVDGGGVAEYFSLECSLRGQIAYEDSKCLVRELFSFISIFVEILKKFCVIRTTNTLDLVTPFI